MLLGAGTRSGDTVRQTHGEDPQTHSKPPPAAARRRADGPPHPKRTPPRGRSTLFVVPRYSRDPTASLNAGAHTSADQHNRPLWARAFVTAHTPRPAGSRAQCTALCGGAEADAPVPPPPAHQPKGRCGLQPPPPPPPAVECRRCTRQRHRAAEHQSPNKKLFSDTAMGAFRRDKRRTPQPSSMRAHSHATGQNLPSRMADTRLKPPPPPPAV